MIIFPPPSTRLRKLKCLVGLHGPHFAADESPANHALMHNRVCLHCLAMWVLYREEADEFYDTTTPAGLDIAVWVRIHRATREEIIELDQLEQTL